MKSELKRGGRFGPHASPSRPSADGDLYIEKYLVNPRHIEFQILGDTHGNVIHLGERECSIQRRHQKLIEESPSPALTPELRAGDGRDGCQASPGRFNMKAPGPWSFSFPTASTTFVESEYPHTGGASGDRDGDRHRHRQGADTHRHGPALEHQAGRRQTQRLGHRMPHQCRRPSEQFRALDRASLRGYRSPGGVGIRVDSGVYTRYTIPHYYDPMISKLVAWGRDRHEAILRMRRALYEYIIVGVKTNIPFPQSGHGKPALRVRGFQHPLY